MKTALCISGQMRTYERAYPFIKKHLLDPLSPDVFIHTWTDLGTPVQARQMLSPAVKRMKRYFPLLERPLVRFVKAYESSGSRHSKENTVDPDRLTHLFSPREMVIEEFPENGLWSLHGKSVPDVLLERIEHLDCTEGPSMIKKRAVVGGLPMFYKMHACHELACEYARKNDFAYDLIIRLRPDIRMIRPLPLDPFPAENEVHISSMSPSPKSMEIRVSDQMAWGRPKAMDFYCEPWKVIEYLYRGMADDEDYTLFGGEKLEKYHFSRQGTYTPVHQHVHDALLRPALDPKRTCKAIKSVFGF